MPNGAGIKKETFVEADEKTRIALTFDLLEEIHDKLERLQRRKKYDTVAAAGSGAGMGFLAVWLKSFWPGGG